jgi:LmbE family N-acetylglucosaminyl deacetylase
VSTIVFFHAHPDDEVLLTGGSMALLAAQGHRVVLVTATAGEAGLTGAPAAREPASLGGIRRQELHEAARILGCARTVVLGFPDAGSEPVPRAGSFATLPVAEPAEQLARVLAEEGADALTGYDPAGGYGHPDHVQVHHVARCAARLARTPVLLEATVDRRALQRALRLVAPFTRGAPDFRATRFDRLYTAPGEITHTIDVRRFADAKRAAMRAHASQATADDATRTLERFLRLPLPLFRAVFGREWFVQPGITGVRRSRRLPIPGAPAH